MVAMPDRRARADDCRSLLIVDDDPGFRAVARELLHGAAFRVVGEAADGAGCLEQVRALRPEVVLLDVQLPDASGFQVCRAIVDADAADGTGVVLCSVREAADYGPAVRRCGARAFVSKAGLSAQALLRLIEG
jgi:DNA-binding NarL/FixJ family response regulator